MSDIIRTEVKVDVAGITNKVESVIHRDDTMLEVHQVFAKVIDPWVPYDTGALSQHLDITPTGVTYTEPYAAKQYYGDEFKHTTEHHPLASAHWDEVAMQTERANLAMQVKEILVRRLNNG